MTTIQYLPYTGQVTTDNNRDLYGEILRITVQLQATHDQAGPPVGPGCLVDNLLYRVLLINTITGDTVDDYIGPWSAV